MFDFLTVKLLAYVSGGLLAALLAASAALWVQSQRLDAARGEAALLTQRLGLAEAGLQAARTSASSWQTTTLELQVALSERIERERAERALSDTAVAEARQRAGEANATLRAWLDRYEAATRGAECAAQLAAPICTD